MATFNAETLQDMYARVDKKDLTKENAAKYFNTSIGSIGNYFAARNRYNNGREVIAQNVSTKVFNAWAVKYGGKGEPVYKEDPHPERKHVKKEPEQQKMNFLEEKSNEKETIEICGLVIEITIKAKGRD